MKPVLQALVLAERIYEDKSSGKKIIAGTFNRVTIQKDEKVIQEIPGGSKKHLIKMGTDLGSPFAYVSLTDVVDQTDVALQMVNVTKNKVLFEAPIKLSCKDRLATVEIVVPLPPMTTFLREAGTFSFEVVWKGEILGSHRIIVEVIPIEGAT